MPQTILNWFDQADLMGVTVEALTVAKPSYVTVRYANNTGNTVTLPTHNLWLLCNNRQDLAIERFKDQDITPGTVQDGGRFIGSISMFGVKMGDFVRVAYSEDLQRCGFHANVSSNNNVQYIIENQTGADVTLDQGTMRVLVDAI